MKVYNRDSKGRFVSVKNAEASKSSVVKLKVDKVKVDPKQIYFQDLVKVKGVMMLEKSTYKALRAEYGDFVDDARSALVQAHKDGLNLSLLESLLLVSSPGFRWHQISQLGVIHGKKHFLEVLKWINNNSVKRLFKVYPSHDYPGMPKTLDKNVGKADALLDALAKVRSDGLRPSVGSLVYLAKMANLLGWFED
jgi:hypothetical protein